MYGRTRFEHEIDQLGVGRELEVLDPSFNTHVDVFLRREKDWPQWQVLARVNCGALQIERKGLTSVVKKADEILKKGDRLHIADPLPAACVTALRQPAASTFRDYAFAPGSSGYDKALQQYLDLRPQSLRLKNPSDLAGLVKTLIKGAEVPNPIRHIVLGAHAHSAGMLGLRLNSASSQPYITKEDLDKPSTISALEIPAAVLKPRPKDAFGADIPAAVHIKGCRVGDNAAFLQSLKKALGGGVVVTAPAHFHFLKIRSKNGKLVELWEYMSYDFTVSALNPLTRDQAIDLYVKRKPPFMLIDTNTGIPKATWERWIPASGWGRWKPRQGDAPEFQYIEVDVDVVMPITGKTETLKNVAALRYYPARVLTIPNIFGGTADPRTEKNRKAIVRTTLDSNPIETRKLLEKHNLGSLDDVMAGDWRFEPRSRTDRTLAARLVRHEYTVMRPVVDPPTNTLYMNMIHPVTTRTDRFELLEKDKRFFGSA
jgi:hypothetical protein